MAAELVNSATNEKLRELDWSKNIEICELVGRDQRQAKDVIKAIKKRLGSKNSNTQLLAVMLLEMLMNNIGEAVHRQVIDNGLLPILVKIVKKKTDLPVREKIFLLLDATQTSLSGASGKFPQYYSAYYDLVSAGVQFPQRPPTVSSNPPTSLENRNRSNGVELASSKHEEVAWQASQVVQESSIIQKAGAALEVLRDVLDACDAQHPEGAQDEFTLDLVEQCSFQKQRLMHLVMTSRDEKLVSQAIELNEQLHQILCRHDAILSGVPISTENHVNHGREEEEEAEQLFRRLQKGKACALPEDEGRHVERPPFGLLGAIPGEMLNRPLIRPVSMNPSRPLASPPSSAISPPSSAIPPPSSAIPPPPAKHIEREKYFQESKGDGSALAGHMRSLSLHSRNASSSHSGSMDSSD